MGAINSAGFVVNTSTACSVKFPLDNNYYAPDWVDAFILKMNVNQPEEN